MSIWAFQSVYIDLWGFSHMANAAVFAKTFISCLQLPLLHPLIPTLTSLTLSILGFSAVTGGPDTRSHTANTPFHPLSPPPSCSHTSLAVCTLLPISFSPYFDMQLTCSALSSCHQHRPDRPEYWWKITVWAAQICSAEDCAFSYLYNTLHTSHQPINCFLY